MDSGRRPSLIAVVAGVLLGLFSMLADGVIGGRLIGLLGNIASPWGLTAFFVGRRTSSLRRGAVAGTVTLVVGVATYYLAAAVRGSVLANADAVWIVVALVAGPIMGLCGAATVSRVVRSPIVAVVPPAAMLVGEAIFLAIDRRVWRWNLGAEPYRLIDLAVMLAMLIGGFALAGWLRRSRARPSVVFVPVAVAGLIGAAGFVLLRELIVRYA